MDNPDITDDIDTGMPAVTDEQLEKALRVIRKLLDRAEATPFPAEAEEATAKAAELMARYRIDAAVLDAARTISEDRIGKHIVDVGAGPYMNARFVLLAGLAREFGCRSPYYTRRTGRQVELFGHQSDIAAVEMLYTSLLVQALTAVNAEKVPAGVAATTWKRAFLTGFANTVVRRVHDANKTALQNTPSNTPDPVTAATGSEETDGDTTADAHAPGAALVLRQRSERVEDEFKVAYPRLRAGRAAAPIGHTGGYSRGGEAGKTASIDRRSSVSTRTRGSLTA
jgi:hypothetical protein